MREEESSSSIKASFHVLHTILLQYGGSSKRVTFWKIIAVLVLSTVKKTRRNFPLLLERSYQKRRLLRHAAGIPLDFILQSRLSGRSFRELKAKIT